MLYSNTRNDLSGFCENPKGYDLCDFVRGAKPTSQTERAKASVRTIGDLVILNLMGTGCGKDTVSAGGNRD